MTGPTCKNMLIFFQFIYSPNSDAVGGIVSWLNCEKSTWLREVTQKLFDLKR